jgi:hypothetical protein
MGRGLRRFPPSSIWPVSAESWSLSQHGQLEEEFIPRRISSQVCAKRRRNLRHPAYFTYIKNGYQMDPNYPLLPAANVGNITNGYNA